MRASELKSKQNQIEDKQENYSMNLKQIEDSLSKAEQDHKL